MVYYNLHVIVFDYLGLSFIPYNGFSWNPKNVSENQ